MPGDVSGQQRLTSLPSRSELAAYRLVVADVAEEVRTRGPGAVEKGRATVVHRLAEPELAGVLSWVPGGIDCVAAALTVELENFRPNPRSSARDLSSLARVYLLSQIDTVWWRTTPPFDTDADVLRSSELVDLDPLRKRRLLRFHYRAQPAGRPGRTRDWLTRRISPGRRPHTAGLLFTRARRESLALLNQLAARLPADLPPVWVTSLVRSVEHQHRLRALGYAAVLPSSHCVGHGLDIEMRWYRRFDHTGRLPALLLNHQDAGELNVINEGQAWHVCINPDHAARLWHAYTVDVAPR